MLRCLLLCDVALLYERDFVVFGFLTEAVLLLSFLLNTDELDLLTFLVLLNLGATLFALDLDRVAVALSFLLVLFGEVTLAFERVVLASSERCV